MTKRLTMFVLIMAAAALTLFYAGCQDSQVVNPTTEATAMGNYSAAAVAKAMTTQELATDDLLKIDGVVGTGVGLDDNGVLCIKVFTAPRDVAFAGKIAREIGGLPVVTEEIGDIYAHALTGRYRPVPIGVSAGNVTAGTACMAGTLGCVVLKGSTKYALSNNHVFARENAAAIGEDVHQPGSLDAKPQCTIQSADKIGDLSDFEPIKFGGQNNSYDAAIAQYSTTDVTCATLSSYYGFPGTSPVNATVGMAIKKVGRTTSLTTGTVVAINATVNVGYSGGTAKFVGQIVTSRRFDKSGDSGSLVVTNNGSNSPVALLFAGTRDGTAIVSPIGPVLQRFGASVCGN